MLVKDIAWLGGLLEGEGHFGSDPRGSLARIKLEMQDADTVRKAAVLMGARGIKRSFKRNPRHSTTYWFYLTGAKAASWMMTLWPFLGRRRRDQVKASLTHWQVGLVAREALRQEQNERYFIRQRSR